MKASLCSEPSGLFLFYCPALANYRGCSQWLENDDKLSNFLTDIPKWQITGGMEFGGEHTRLAIFAVDPMCDANTSFDSPVSQFFPQRLEQPPLLLFSLTETWRMHPGRSTWSAQGRGGKGACFPQSSPYWRSWFLAKESLKLTILYPRLYQDLMLLFKNPLIHYQNHVFTPVFIQLYLLLGGFSFFFF